jgi:hypothetical protein
MSRHPAGSPNLAQRQGLCKRAGTSAVFAALARQEDRTMIRRLKSGQYRLYSRKPDPRTHKRRNLGTFDTREAAEKHEREVQYFKRH